MEGGSKTSAGAVAGLPDDPLVEILSRVPAKSVCRFKCVSKAWRDLIAHPDHRKKLRQAMQGLFLQTSEVSKVDNTRLTRTSFSFIDLTTRSVPLDIDSCFSFLTELLGIQTLFFQDSCNGLILFGHHQVPSHLSDGYIVCNPTTRQWSAVPAGGSPAESNHTYLAFDPAVSSHFHLVQFQMAHVYTVVESLHVYSSETGTWSQNQIDQHLEEWHGQSVLHSIHHQRRCAFVNGFLHFIVLGSRQHMLALDVLGKATRLITVPGMADGRPGHGFVYYLGQSQGHLHCVTLESADNKNDKLSTWVLQDYDTQEWVLKSTVNSLDVFGEIGVWPIYQVVDIHQDYNHHSL